MTDAPMTFDQFKSKLKVADWLHPLADDQRAWRRGMDECKRLEYIAKAQGPEWVAAYEAASSAAWARVRR